MLWGITFTFGSRARLLLTLSVIPSDMYSASGSLLRISSGRTAIESIWPPSRGIFKYKPIPIAPAASIMAVKAAVRGLIAEALFVEAPSSARRRSVADWKRPSGDFDRHLSTIAWRSEELRVWEERRS